MIGARWRRLALALALSLAWAPVGCAATIDNSKLGIPAPVESTTLGAGDVFRLEIVGEKDLPTEFQVAADGTVDFPYIQRQAVAGLEPQQVSALVRRRLMEGKFRSDPSVVVTVKEYNSKRISVLGQVAKPGSFPFRSGLTLVEAISLAGGLSAIANDGRVYLTRRTGREQRTWQINVADITEGRSPDIPLQAGDQIFVNERVF